MHNIYSLVRIKKCDAFIPKISTNNAKQECQFSSIYIFFRSWGPTEYFYL